MTRTGADIFKGLDRELCPVCGRARRCKSNSSRDVVLCFRQTEEQINGFRRIKQTGECCTYVRTGSPADDGSPATPTKGDWRRKAEDFAARLPRAKLVALAKKLHVAPDALKRINVGWNERQFVFTFPEADASGQIVGIIRRWIDGRQKAMHKCRRGLVLPDQLDRSKPLLIVEGASDTAAALTVGLQAVGRPNARGGVAHLAELLTDASGDIIIVGENDKKADGSWPGRDGAKAVAGALARRLGRPIACALPTADVKDLREWVAREVPDLSDAEARRTAGERILAALRERSETVSEADAADEPAGGDAKKGGPSQSTLLVQLVERAGVKLFHDGDTGYATVPVDEHVETWPIRHRGFKRWLARGYYKEHAKPPSNQPLQDALGVLEGKAEYEGPERKVFIRVGHAGDTLYIDLADKEWRIVEVTADGWRVIQAADAPVRFRRSRGMLALPEPVCGGDLADLRRFVNVGSDADFILTCAWLVGALQPRGPYPPFVPNGEQGSAKSFMCRVLRRLIDSNEAELRSEPRDERDLVIAANNGLVIALDNLSRVKTWLSDALCRIANGGGFATRELYTDSDEIIFSSQRPIIANGIEEVVTRPDLLDRAIILTLPPILEADRRDEAELWAAFEAARPRLLGALLTAVSAALRGRDKVELDRRPRMADFAKWIVAAEQGGGVPWPQGAFMDAYAGNRAAAVESAIEASVIGPTLLRWLGGRDAWTGTWTELLGELDAIADDRAKRSRGWPKTGRGLSGALRRLGPPLRARGIEFESGHRGRGRGKQRTITVRQSSAATVPIVPNVPDPSSQAEDGELWGRSSEGADANEGRGDANATRNRPPENAAGGSEDAVGDGGDDGDAGSRTHSGLDGAPVPDPAAPDLVYDEDGEVVGVAPSRKSDEWGDV